MSHAITIRPSGHRFRAEPDEAILDAAERHGIVLPYGCRNGACGGCQGLVVEGAIVYPDGDTSGPGSALFCQARATSDLVIEVAEIELGAQLQPRERQATVRTMGRLTHDVMRLQLELENEERMQFLAGQYIEILTADGHRRAFSLANAPHDDRYIELHVRFVAGGEFTEHVFATMQTGEVLRIDGPRGTFYLREGSDQPALLIAGGTGFAPLKGVLEHAFHIGLHRPFHLYWGVRAKRDFYQLDLIKRWLAEQPGFRFTPVLSEPEADDAWEGRTGFVHEVVAADYPDASAHEMYACGPPVMVKAAYDALSRQGLAANAAFSDAFEFGALSDD